MAVASRKEKVMEEEDVIMVKQMVSMVTVPRCMEDEEEIFMQEDTVIFMPRLHRMGCCKTMVNV